MMIRIRLIIIVIIMTIKISIIMINTIISYAKGDQNDNFDFIRDQIDHEENCSNNNNYNSDLYHIIHYDIHNRNMK